MKKIDFNIESYSHIFRLFDKNSPFLCFIGISKRRFYKGDICIYKNRFSEHCHCEESSLHLETKNCLVGKTGDDNQFKIKRIVVFEMYETEEMKLLKKQLIFDEKEKKQIKIKEEDTLIELNSKFENIPIEIKTSIEEWTNLKFKSFVFDSNYCDWNILTSTFGDRIIGKEKLIFIVEHESSDYWFGCYIDKIITNYKYIDENGDARGIRDENSFIFSL